MLLQNAMFDILPSDLYISDSSYIYWACTVMSRHCRVGDGGSVGGDGDQLGGDSEASLSSTHGPLHQSKIEDKAFKFCI
jgi:hypothetical protein